MGQVVTLKDYNLVQPKGKPMVDALRKIILAQFVDQKMQVKVQSLRTKS